MPKPAAYVGSAAHLKEQPRQTFCADRRLGRQKGTEFFRQIDEHGTGLKDAGRGGGAPVEERRDFGIWVDGHKAAAELIALTDVDQVGIVLGLLDAEFKEFLQQDGHLDAIGRGKRIEL